MPITRELTPEELKNLDDQGVDSSAYKGQKVTLLSDDELEQQQKQQVPQTADTKPGIAKSILATEKAHAGGQVGGGLGAIGGGALAGSLFEPGIGTLIGGLIGGALGGAGGGYAGQKLQDVALGQQTTADLQKQYEEAQQAHPYVTLGSDIVGSALASGGKFNVGNISKALSGDSEAVGKIALNSLVNPAINTGLQYASTGELPTGKELAAQAIGGSLFSEQANWAGKITGHGGTEPAPEPSFNEPNQSGAGTGYYQGSLESQSPYTRQDNSGKPMIDDTAVKQAFASQLNLKPDVSGMSPEDRYQAQTQWRQISKTPTDDMRQALHQKWIQDYIDQQMQDSTKQPIVRIPGQEPSGEPVAKVGENDIPVKQPAEGVLTDSNKDTNPPAPVVATTEPEPVKDSTLPVQHETDANKYAPADDYSKAQATMRQLIQEGKQHTPEFMDAWRASEQAKNTNKGMPPSEPTPGSVQSIRKHGNLQDSLRTIDAVKNGTKPVGLITGADRASMPQLSEAIANSGLRQDPRGFIYRNTDEGINNYNKVKALDSAYQSNTYNPKTFMSEFGKALGYKQQEIDEFLGTKRTVGSLLSTLKDNPIASHLLAVGGDSLNKPVSVDEAGRSRYNPSEGVKLQPNHLDSPYVITHEAVHALSSDFIDKNPNHPLVQQLEGLRQLAENHLGKEPYGVKDVHEFLAEGLSNKDFQNQLDNIKTPSQKTLWEHFVDTIRRMLGMAPKDSTLLDKTLRASDELLKTANPKEGEENASIQRKVQEDNQQEYKGTNELQSPSETGSRYSPPDRTGEEEKVIPKTSSMGRIGEWTKSSVDKVADIAKPGTKDTASAEEVAGAFKGAFNQGDREYGKFGTPVIEAGNKLSKRDWDKVEAAKEWERQNKQDPTFMLTNNAQRNYMRVVRNSLIESGKEQIAKGEPVLEDGHPRPLQQDPHYHYTTMAPKAAEILRANTDLKAIESMHKDYIENAMKYGKSKDNAEIAWNQTRQAVQGTAKNEGGNMQFYNAVRREQGTPLPPSMRRANPQENDQVYWMRRARDRAFYDNIESNPRVWSALGADKDAWNRPIPKDPTGGIAGNKYVQAVLHEFHGEAGSAGNQEQKALSAAATRGMIAWPGLEGHIGISNIIGVTTYADNPAQLMGMLSHAVKTIGEGVERAKENGIIKPTARSLSGAWDSNRTFAENLNSVANTFGRIASLNNVGHILSTGFMQSAMEWKLPITIAKAAKGSVQDQQFLKKLDPYYKVGQTYDSKGVQQLASLASAYIAGTHDGRTMPGWMTSDSEVSGFFKLAHWSIAQTNRFMSDVYTPAAQHGNYTPLLTSLFGSAVGGYLIKQLRQELSGKKGQMPDLTDISASEGGLSGHKSLVAYNMIAAAQYAGFAGLLSQVVKYPFDFVYKNRPQGATFPLDQIAEDSVNNLKNISTAIANDPNINWLDLTKQFFKETLSNDFAMGRMMYNQGVNSGAITGTSAEKKELIDKLGDLRRFKEIQGIPYADTSEAENPYMNLEQKKFKLTQDPKEIAQQLPGLIQNIVQNYSNNPDVMLAKLKALKQNEYETMPSLDEEPLQFKRYVDYLNKRVGPDKAQGIITDYFTHKIVNEAKASLVP